MGQMLPSASFMSAMTESKSALPMKPVSGLNAPMPIISTSHDCLAERSMRVRPSASLVSLGGAVGGGDAVDKGAAVRAGSGRTWVAIAGFNTVFGDGFDVTPGAASGVATTTVTGPAGAVSSTTVLGQWDVVWVTFDIVAFPPDGRHITGPVAPAGNAGEAYSFSTFGSSVGTTMALFDEMGNIVALNDDGSINGSTSFFSFTPDAGDYYLFVVGDDADFFDGFLSPGWADVFEGPVFFELNDQVDVVTDLTDENPLVLQLSFVEPCDVPCPPLALSESEPAYDIFEGETDTVNAGCATVPNLFSPAVLGQTWCGTTRTQLRVIEYPSSTTYQWRYDNDFYEVYLSQPTALTITLDAEFDGLLLLYDLSTAPPVCDDNDYNWVARGDVTRCSSTQISELVFGGRYAINVSSDLPENGGPMPYTLRIEGRPVPLFELGAVATEGEAFDLSTLGSDFDTELAVYDDFGGLIDFNDDASGAMGAVHSELPDVVLPAGDYLAVVAGYNVDFYSRFGVDATRFGRPPATDNGFVELTIGSETRTSFINSAEAVWAAFSVEPASPCNGADLALPFGQLTFGDIGAFLGAFNAMDPAADLATPFGVFTFGDIGAFLGLFSAGCP
jgi:hypothetical protein